MIFQFGNLQKKILLACKSQFEEEHFFRTMKKVHKIKFKVSDH